MAINSPIEKRTERYVRTLFHGASWLPLSETLPSDSFQISFSPSIGEVCWEYFPTYTPDRRLQRIYIFLHNASQCSRLCFAIQEGQISLQLTLLGPIDNLLGAFPVYLSKLVRKTRCEQSLNLSIRHFFQPPPKTHAATFAMDKRACVPNGERAIHH